MAGYTTHITYSTAAGTGLGAFAYLHGFPLPMAIFGGALCSFGGIIPDIDSKTSTSFRQCLAMLAGFTALLFVSRLSDFTLDPESVILVGSSAFLVIWFFIGGLIRKFTRHRGMFHSIPMALIFGEIIYILSSGDLDERLFKGFCIFLGFMIHLLLDEIYSVESNGVKVRIKKSFGTAVKMIDFDNMLSTVLIYLILAFTTQVAIHSETMTSSLEAPEVTKEDKAREVLTFVRKKNPNQFDLAVIEWVAENHLILEPDSKNNVKWQQMEKLFESSKESKIANNSASAPSGNRTEMAVNLPDGHVVTNKAVNTKVDEAPSNEPSFLDRLMATGRYRARQIQQENERDGSGSKEMQKGSWFFWKNKKNVK